MKQNKKIKKFTLFLGIILGIAGGAAIVKTIFNPVSSRQILINIILYLICWGLWVFLVMDDQGKISKTVRNDVNRNVDGVLADTVDLGKNFVTWLTRAIEAVAVSAVLAAVVYFIIADGGIEALLARTMAAACRDNPAVSCDFQTTLAILGMALVLLTSMVIYALRLFNTQLNGLVIDEPEISNNYNDDMVSLLRDIQRLKVVKNLKGLADWKGMAPTTVHRYVDIFEKDGYVSVTRNGKGSPTEVYAE